MGYSPALMQYKSAYLVYKQRCKKLEEENKKLVQLLAVAIADKYKTQEECNCE